MSATLDPKDLRVLGDFLACAADVDRLRQLTGRAPPVELSLEPADLSQPEWEQGREFAGRARAKLGLGDAAIESMVALLEDQLRWTLFFVLPEQLSPDVHGACTHLPTPAILINLISGRDAWWRTRVSLAHELCHVLYDTGSHGRPYLISPDGKLMSRGNWELVERFRGIERRANAFAVHFLAPDSGIRACVGGDAPDSQDVINRVCVTFGIGREVAIHRLGHVYDLSGDAKERALYREPQATHERAHPDAAVHVGLRSGKLHRLTLEAARCELIDPVEARSILRVPMSSALPDAGIAEAPLVSDDLLARARAEAHERALGTQQCWAGDARRLGDRWEVELHYRQGDSMARKIVQLSPGFAPLSSG